MKIEVTREELQLVLVSLDYRENFYAYSGAEVLPELNALNELYNRLSEIQQEITPEREMLEAEIQSLNEVISVHAIKRRVELRNDPTVDQARIGDLIRIELAQLRSQRDRLYSELDRIQGRQLTQEHGIER
jgi:division protein CdvB (Snf7/Vps24/ESCRT-III family)